MAGGRPSKYSGTLAADICSRIASGEPLTRICEDDDKPHVATIYRWLLEHDEFRDIYARAREDQAETLADEILKIADESPVISFQERGGETVTVVDGAAVQHQRLRIDARKWVAAKLKPKKYGDKTEVSVAHSGVVAHEHRSVSETAAFLTDALGGGADRAPTESLPH